MSFLLKLSSLVTSSTKHCNTHLNKQCTFKTMKRCALNATMSKRAQSTSGFVTIDANVDLYYEQYGSTSNKNTLICMPGALGSVRSDFAYQLDHLSKDFNILAYDPRGYGKSQKSMRQFPLTYFHQDASDVAMLMDKLGYRRYSVLGWSDGGIAATILAAQHRACIQNLIIWGAAAYVTEEDKQLMEATKDLSNWSERMRAPLEKVFGKDRLQSLWSDFIHGYSAFADNPNGNICIPECADIICPTLIVHGVKDPLVPTSHAEFLHKHIKGSKLVLMPDGKHNLHMRYYEEFNKMVTEFVKPNLEGKL